MLGIYRKKFCSVCNHGRGWGLGLVLTLCTVFARGQVPSVLYVYDPVRHTIVTSTNDASLKRFEKIGNLKKQLIFNKERTAANYLILNVIEEHLYNKEKKLSDGNLSRLTQLYDQSVADIADFWDQYEETYILGGDTIRQRCEPYYLKAKENSDYELDQINQRVAKYVKQSGFIANNKERILMMNNCYERIKAEKARVIKHGRVLFSLAVYSEGFEDRKMDVLKEILNK